MGMSSTPKNPLAIAAGENYDRTHLYERSAKTAKQEGSYLLRPTHGPPFPFSLQPHAESGRTITDLESAEHLLSNHLAKAIGDRKLDRGDREKRGIFLIYQHPKYTICASQQISRTT